MRLRELDIEHYGVFSEYRMPFAGGGLQLIYGPNEAGKSTLLQLIREVLFGFAARNRYAFADHTGEMAATLLVDLKDGRSIQFRRRKGRRNVLTGQYLDSGQTLDESEWQRVLSGAGPELFDNVFGFSLSELMAAEQSLQKANLNEALYGGALGGLASFQQVLQDLHAEHEQLFTPTAKKRPVNALLTRIKALTAELKQAQLKPRDYNQLRQQAEELATQVTAARNGCDDLRRRRDEYQRLVAAVELWIQRAAQVTQLETLNVPTGFPIDGGQQWQQLRARHLELEKEAADFAQELDDVDQQLTQLNPHADLIAQAGTIRQLYQRLELIRGFRRDVVLRAREAREVQEDVANRLAALNSDWQTEQLGALVVTPVQQSRFEQLRQAREQLDTRRRELQAQRPALLADIGALETRLEALPADTPTESLESLLDKSADYLANRDRMTDARAALTAMESKLTALVARVVAPFQLEPAALAALPVPIPATLEEYQLRWNSLHEALQEEQRELERLQRQLRDRRDDLETLRTDTPTVDRQSLLSTRQRRDAGWRLLRRQFVEHQDVEPERWQETLNTDERGAADAYEAAVTEADHVADQRQSCAEAVARQDECGAAIDAGRRAVATQQERVDQARTQVDQLKAQWLAVWTPCGLQPESPSAMSQWLSWHAELLDITAQRDALCDRVNSLADQVRGFEMALSETTGDGTSDEQLAKVRRRVTAAHDVASERRTLSRELPSKRHQLETLDHELIQIDQQIASWQEQWTALLGECGFDTEWDTATALRIVVDLNTLRAEYDKTLALERRVADMQNGLRQFVEAATTVVQHAATDLVELPAEDAVETVVQRLDQAQQDQRDLEMLVERKTRLRDRVASKQEQLDQSANRCAAFMESAGVDSEQALLDVARQAARAGDLQRDIDAADNKLAVLRGDEANDDFDAKLQASDPAAVESELQIVATQLQNAERLLHDVVSQHGAAQERLAMLESGSRAADKLLDIEGARSELQATIEQWAPLVIAEATLRDAITRFEREHQPQLLADAGRLINHMTGGRYVALRRRLDDAGTLLLETANGQLRPPSQLSTGTREQLYLAIRLAYVGHYCQQAEPLPIVMDDVLVNFDDARAASTLHVLQQVSADIQVILMTCHENTVNRAQDVITDVPIHELAVRGN